MSYLDVKKFKFNDIPLRGFNLFSIDNIEKHITDVEVKFQKNRAIVFTIIVDDTFVIEYLNKNELKLIKGKYYHYSFIATINSMKNTGFHFPFYSFDIIVDLIEFYKNNTNFISSKENYNLEIIPTKNMIKYLERRKQKDLLKFDDITFNDYNLKYRYLIELNSFIYNTPILIEKIFLKYKKHTNILFQSQYINNETEKDLSEIYPFFQHGHFNCSLDKYLDKFIEFKKSNYTLDLLLKIYFIDDIFRGKKDYHLNDISGLIDLFDGIFIKLKELENIEITKKIRYEKFDNKIQYVLNSINNELNKYIIDNNETLKDCLQNFRHMIRHQKEFKEYNLNKLYDFSKGILKLYIIKNILKIDNNDYDINRVLKDFNIYPLVKHIYKYFDKEIVIYNTELNNYGHQVLTENTTYFQILKEQDIFKNSKPEDFIYDDSKTIELKKIYIAEEDRVKRSLIFFGIITIDKVILQSQKYSVPYLHIKYDELLSNLGISNIKNIAN
ncbi:MAG: hypothetical protein KAQ94_05545 [Arcobacteraceae bacterium]|nr:hypothetical protein [Arcobacteraceae bacterium]